ncbi:MAG TPA: FHA domain-containing protein [Pyrinomonadaceae bacterium]|nr:FHA domain-containing protein [Pyrinomonadaceae bacterium]
MEKITLKINDETDFEVANPMVTIGRGSDNVISFPDDTNVSRYHARIEQREDGFWLVEQGSSNGTTLNGEDFDGEILLQDGDTILFGGSSKLGVQIIDDEAEDDEDDESESSASAVETAPPAAAAAKSNSSLLLVAGGVIGLAVIFVAAAGIYYWATSTSKCDATAKIISPDSGETISEAVDVEIEVKDSSQCVQKAVFVLGEKEFASASAEPYKVTLDPQQFPDDLADGNTYGLKVVLIDTKGQRISQSNEIALAFEVLETKPKEPEITQTQPTEPTTKPVQTTKVGVIDTQTMVINLLKQFSGTPKYKIDQQFLVEVNKKSAEYVSEGYFARASQYKDTINVEYVSEKDLDAPLGYILAMSRSKFNNQKQGNEEGLWRISKEVLEANGFNLAQVCGTETLSDPSQKCSAKVSALYLKSLVLNVFERDLIYSIVAVGMPPNDAAAFKATLPANREDFWNVIKSPKQREEVVNFFAAGIVAENPQKFGLKKDHPISELYRNLVGN